jgi:hypothetical protein
MLTGSEVRVFADGNEVAKGTAHWSKQIFPLNQGVVLQPGSKITASQAKGTDASPQSPPAIVQKQPPTVGTVAFGPVFRCGRCLTCNGALPGAVVRIAVGGTQRGEASAPTGEARIKLSQPTQAGDILQATQSACGGAPGPSVAAEQPLQPQSKLPAPTLKQPHACETTLHVSGVTVGATVTLERSNGPKLTFCFDRPSLYVIVNPAFKEAETIKVTQALPACKLTSPEAKTTALPTKPVPMPAMDSFLCPASKFAWVFGLVPGAEVAISIDGGEPVLGAGPRLDHLQLPAPARPSAGRKDRVLAAPLRHRLRQGLEHRPGFGVSAQSALLRRSPSLRLRRSGRPRI